MHEKNQNFNPFHWPTLTQIMNDVMKELQNFPKCIQRPFLR